jgi:GAF domain-containing protein
MIHPALLSGLFRVLLWLALALLCSTPGCSGREALAGEGMLAGSERQKAHAIASADPDAAARIRYPPRSLVVGALVLLEALVIAYLLRERTSRRRAELSLADRLRFEELLSELSARLIPVSLRDVDVEIVAGLARVVEFLRVDRGSLDEHVPGGSVLRIARAGGASQEGPPAFKVERFPWSVERLRQGHMVRFSRPEDLPDDAAVDRQEYRRLGTRSCLALPLHANGVTVGVLTFDCVAAERSWSPALRERLQLLGVVFAGALERKRLELLLAERLRFETLLSEQSATFSSLSATEIDREIERAMRRIADFVKADWGSLAEFSHDARVARITHSWAVERATQSPAAVSLSEIPWAVAEPRACSSTST